MRTGAMMLAVTLAACLTDPGTGSTTDAAPPADSAVDAAGCDGDSDGDGYVELACGGALPADCNDGDSAIHPGAFDDPTNAVDEDCLDGALAPNDALVPNAYAEDDNNLTVQNADLQVTFSRAANYRATELFALGGLSPAKNLLFADLTINERLTGTNAFPAWFGWDPVIDPTLSHVTQGRAAARFRVEWIAGDGNGMGATEDCGWCGDTYVTVLPDGRIHTFEDVQLQSGSASFVTAYVALHHDAVSHVDWSNNAEAPFALVDQTPATIYDGDVDPADWTCAYDVTAEHVVGWSYQVPAGQVAAGPRIFQSFSGAPQVALQFDWIGGGGAPLAHYVGSFLTIVRGVGASEPCEPIDDSVQALRDPARLDVAPPGQRFVAAIGDADGDGYSEGGGFYSVRAGDDEQTSVSFVINAVGARVPPTLAVAIQQMNFARDPVVVVDGARLSHGRDYLFHASETSGEGWIFFGQSVGLSGGSSVHVTVP